MTLLSGAGRGGDGATRDGLSSLAPYLLALCLGTRAQPRLNAGVHWRRHNPAIESINTMPAVEYKLQPQLTLVQLFLPPVYSAPYHTHVHLAIGSRYSVLPIVGTTLSIS